VKNKTPERVFAEALARGIQVDAADEYLLRERLWTVSRQTGKRCAYAVARINGRLLSLHNMILQPKPGFTVDHINKDGLDNRRENLRYASHSENLMNRGKPRGCLCRYKGVTKRRGRYMAFISTPSSGFLSARVASEEDGAKQYDLWAKQYYGEFASLNFPQGV